MIATNHHIFARRKNCITLHDIHLPSLDKYKWAQQNARVYSITTSPLAESWKGHPDKIYKEQWPDQNLASHCLSNEIARNIHYIIASNNSGRLHNHSRYYTQIREVEGACAVSATDNITLIILKNSPEHLTTPKKRFQIRGLNLRTARLRSLRGQKNKRASSPSSPQVPHISWNRDPKLLSSIFANSFWG